MVDMERVAQLAAREAARSGAPIELNLGDQWIGRWEDEEPIPQGVPVLHVYGVLLMDDKGYVTRARGTDVWGTIEGTVADGEKAEAAIKRIAKEQANATAALISPMGYLDCRATSHNPTHHKDSRAVRPLYLVAAKQIKDLGREAATERRRLPMNEYMMALRGRYPEIDDYLGTAVERYMIMRARGEL